MMERSKCDTPESREYYSSSDLGRRRGRCTRQRGTSDSDVQELDRETILDNRVGGRCTCVVPDWVPSEPTGRGSLRGETRELPSVRWAAMVWRHSVRCLASTRSSQLSYTRKSEKCL